MSIQGRIINVSPPEQQTDQKIFQDILLTDLIFSFISINIYHHSVKNNGLKVFLYDTLTHTRKGKVKFGFTWLKCVVKLRK